jgi:ketosteroid isomerase-like protein
MSKHVAISPEEAADRLAIRELVEAYAHCADRRDAKGQMSLFTEDTHFVVFAIRNNRRRWSVAEILRAAFRVRV